jgi:hypothetical protein
MLEQDASALAQVPSWEENGKDVALGVGQALRNADPVTYVNDLD